MRKFPKALILSTLAVLVFLPRLGETCGPFFSTATFVRAHGPDRPMADFARGRIGVVLPDWHEAYRLVAYRYLESKPLSAGEQRSLLEHYDAERHIEPPDWTGKAAQGWTSAGAHYNPAPDPTGLTDYKQSQSEFSSYSNCLAPAFDTAVETLQDRARRFGAASPELQEWIRGQDTVFSNCSGGANIPPDLPATSNPLLRADRAYQIAAAHFYAGTSEGHEITKGYEIAIEHFQAIAADKSSPWHSISSYLIARTLVREAGVTAGDGQTYNPAYLAKAEAQLEAILNDPAQQSVHDDAEVLLGLVNYRLHPDQRKAELGKLLAGGKPDIHFGQDLIDYTWLGRRGISPATDDLTDWLSGGGTPEHAIATWRRNRSLPWLVALLWQLKPRDAAFSEVMGAAAKVPPTSEAYATVAYFRARLARESGNDELARHVLKAARTQSNAFPPSAIHLFQDEQMLVATDFATFESSLWQNPIEYDDGIGDIVPCNTADSPECGPQFSPAAATLLNSRVPAEVFARVALWGTFPANLRQRMAPSAWARAALLDQSKLAQQVAEAAGEAQPALRPYLQQYAQAQTREERQFAAVFAILHFPGLRPFVDSSYPRTTAFQKIDSYRDNWWCRDVGSLEEEVEYKNSDDDYQGKLMQGTPAPHFPVFLDAGERQRAAAEWQRLSSYGTASRALPRIAIDWARKHPEDARVPEALHLSVRAIRYGCEDGKPNPLSHEAFTILHQNYPKSEWAKKTPFWFK